MGDAPLFPQITYNELVDYLVNAPGNYQRWWISLYQSAPHHVWVETSLLVFIIWLMFIRKTVDPAKSSNKAKLTKQEEEMLIASWNPAPLVETASKLEDGTKDVAIIEYVRNGHIKLKGTSSELINLTSFDFFGMGQNLEVKEAARAALEKYGCGSCGPRGFYGTIDVHLQFEKVIADFMGTDEAICYSDGASAISSEIPAFARKGDLLLVDEACSEPIYTGLTLSRATIQFFSHNNVGELRKILESIRADDAKYKRDSTQQRRWIVVEGVYRNTGNVCPLEKILELKEEFKYRVFLDESISFGTMGNTGRGLTEHFGKSIVDIDILNISLETALGSVGGVCVGTREVVDHQRLSGAGYCFSAAAPPFLSTVAMKSLSLLETDRTYIQKLRENRRLFHSLLKTSDFFVVSNEETVLIHLNLKYMQNFSLEEEILITCAKICVDSGVAVVASTHHAHMKVM